MNNKNMIWFIGIFFAGVYLIGSGAGASAQAIDFSNITGWFNGLSPTKQTGFWVAGAVLFVTWIVTIFIPAEG